MAANSLPGLPYLEVAGSAWSHSWRCCRRWAGRVPPPLPGRLLPQPLVVNNYLIVILFIISMRK